MPNVITKEDGIFRSSHIDLTNNKIATHSSIYTESSFTSWNLMEYISSLTDSSVSILFSNQSCVIELYSSLTELEQQVTIRLAMIGTNPNLNMLGEKAMQLWVLPSKQDELFAALKHLRLLKVIKANILKFNNSSNTLNSNESTNTIGSNISIQYSLNTEFQKSLYNYLINGLNDNQILNSNLNISNEGKKVRRTLLTQFVRYKWNNILNIIVEVSGYSYENNFYDFSSLSKQYKIVSKDIIDILLNMGLITYPTYEKDHCKDTVKVKVQNISNSNQLKRSEETSSIIFPVSIVTRSELYDGFEGEEEQILIDTKDNGSIEDFEYLNDISDDEYQPYITKRNKLRKSGKKLQNNEECLKGQMDKIFEQKLVPKAFCWLLCDTCNQLLTLLNEFIKLMGNSNNNNQKNNKQISLDKDLVDVISLIFRLSNSKVGQPILVCNNNNLLSRFLYFAYDLGLIYFDNTIYSKDDHSFNLPIDLSHSQTYLIYTTPYALLLGHDGYQLQSLYPALKVVTSLNKIVDNEEIDNNETGNSILLPSHFYYDQDNEDKDPYNDEYLTEKYSESIMNNNKNNKIVELNNTSNDIDLKISHSIESNLFLSGISNLEAGIIVQSNFRVYCYTASPLQAKILRHLCQVKVRGPNIICGVLTRRGLLSAYSMGVKAYQILRFFISNAHPIILKKHITDGTSIIPISVETQLKLWENDHNRLEINKVSLFSDWGNNKEDIELFKQTVTYAIGKQVVLYHNLIDDLSISENKHDISYEQKIQQLYLAVQQDAEDDIKSFIKAKRELVTRVNI
ncbi:uncharacterized protein CMU_036930 [Cryptosporidium muris RN66]|uniref:General transcription factor IIH subunit 4 n=1 Tax=Cryptosporidium muris (strain RN66) TaxID=441375 RepID=B6AH28_CRYMR|nr:uncharacterized protein CMU_036930 [Cryptosporidium muris RN66]EEA07519.1 hypothetical protein, conserved [Cryptosporidium muris RN66]|eukprot:XP_002141868.1 hypothetical protein [Cryptosporidium muris RN66]